MLIVKEKYRLLMALMLKDLGKENETLVPPPHEPGVLPDWLHHLGADVIIAGGMGQRAISLFRENGIKVITGASELEPEKLINSYLDNTLMTGANVCDH